MTPGLPVTITSKDTIFFCFLFCFCLWYSANIRGQLGYDIVTDGVLSRGWAMARKKVN
jgi:hypothetical protein